MSCIVTGMQSVGVLRDLVNTVINPVVEGELELTVEARGVISAEPAARMMGKRADRTWGSVSDCPELSREQLTIEEVAKRAKPFSMVANCMIANVLEYVNLKK